MHPAFALISGHARPRRWAGLAGLVALVLLLHAWLLGSLPALPGFGGRGEPPKVLQVRQIVQAAPVALAAEEPPDTPAPRPAPPRGTAPVPSSSAADASPAPTAEPAAPAAAPPPATGGTLLPVYATRLPPAVTLQYAVQRDGAMRRGDLQAELRWRPADDGRYELTLSLAATGWASVGAVDAHGLAPERQVETRRGRELRAANFQRDSGRITFSGPQLEFPLLPGAQDRLSWLLQLAAVLEANPALAGAGSEVTLFVAGPRGDAGLWTFNSQGAETAELPAGAISGTVHLSRYTERPYDTRVDVWLDPARHHLPVRLKVQNRAEMEPTDFVLQAVSLP